MESHQVIFISLIAAEIYKNEGMAELSQEEFLKLDLDNIVMNHLCKYTDNIKAQLTAYFDY